MDREQEGCLGYRREPRIVEPRWRLLKGGCVLRGELKTDPAPGPCQASFYYQPARGKTRHAIQ